MAGLIEAWGRGIQRIAKECQSAGLAFPNYKFEFSGLWVELESIEINSSVKTSVKKPEKTSVKMPDEKNFDE